MTSDARRRRQVDELRELCRDGRVGRAIDLAFEHFARFGVDADVRNLLAEVVTGDDQPERVVRRFVELCTSYDEGAGPRRSST